jgi:hypothetical protein
MDYMLLKINNIFMMLLIKFIKLEFNILIKLFLLNNFIYLGKLLSLLGLNMEILSLLTIIINRN